MHLIGVVVLLLIASAVLTRTVSRARAVHRGYPAHGRNVPRFTGDRVWSLGLRSGGYASRSQGARAPAAGSGFLAHRRAMAMERLRHQHVIIRDEVRHKHGLVREWAKHAIRMREREAHWAREDAVKKAPQPETAPGPKRSGTAADAPGSTAPPADGKPEKATVPGTVVTGDAPAPPAPDTPPQPSPPPSPPQPEGKTMSNPGAVEQAVDGMQRVHATAAAGNIRAKQWAIKVCAEILTRVSALALMLSRTVAERGYGPEISEPLARAGVQAQAAAMACGEADTAITSLANMTVGDLADSPRQAPHRSELSETGAH